MKKLVAYIGLTTLLVAGFLFTQESQSTDQAMDLEPSILSIEKPISFF